MKREVLNMITKYVDKDFEKCFNYTDAEERNKHVNEMLHEGWKLSYLGGSGDKMIAIFVKEENNGI